MNQSEEQNARKEFEAKAINSALNLKVNPFFPGDAQDIKEKLRAASDFSEDNLLTVLAGAIRLMRLMPTKVFTVAAVKSQCFGHGDYGNVLSICPEGAYGTGDFPPVFMSRESAESYLAKINLGDRKIVELKVLP